MRNEARVYQMSRLQNQVAPLITQSQGKKHLKTKLYQCLVVVAEPTTQSTSKTENAN